MPYFCYLVLISQDPLSSNAVPLCLVLATNSEHAADIVRYTHSYPLDSYFFIIPESKAKKKDIEFVLNAFKVSDMMLPRGIVASVHSFT